MKRITMNSSTVKLCAKAFALVIFFLLPTGCKPIISLGKNPSGEKLRRIESLPNYQDGQFQNLEPSTAPATNRKKMKWTGIIKHILNRPAVAKPDHILPTMLTNLKTPPLEKPSVIWFGHSSFLLKAKSGTILFDPTFSGYAGPFPGMITAFEGTNHYTVKDLPPIDVLVISHDHYDHLDYTTVRQLRKKVKRVIVPIGVGSHLLHWGYKPEQITELNWHDFVQVNDSLRITATPAHHRSNRTFTQRKTLWSSYVIQAGSYKIYFSGDTGYSKHFDLIGKRYGPFDLAMLECGQYNVKWPQSHLFPWQTARAAQDLKTRVMVPIHWGKFAESTHPWDEPVELLLKSADSLGIAVSVPFIGQPVVVGDTIVQEPWWRMQWNSL